MRLYLLIEISIIKKIAFDKLSQGYKLSDNEFDSLWKTGWYSIKTRKWSKEEFCIDE